MKHLSPRLIIAAFIVLVSASCNRLPGRSGLNSEVVRPTEVLDFNVIYRENCAGCHGSQGKGGAEFDLAGQNPMCFAMPVPPPIGRRFLAIRSTALRCMPSTAHPAMAQTVEGARRPARLPMARTSPW